MESRMPENEKTLILIIDDNAMNLKFLGNLLVEHGYNVAASRSGLEGLGFVAKRTPDLILLDVMMPEVDGFEICRTLKQAPHSQDIPVIFLTALTGMDDKIRGFHAGGDDYITKPFDNEEILARISTHIRLQQQRRELEHLVTARDLTLSVIAHDLRSPICALKSMFSVLNRHCGHDNDVTQKVIHEGEFLVDTTLSLLDNLLGWSYSQRDGIRPAPATISLEESFRECAALLRHQAEKKNIALDIDIPESAAVTADPGMAQTVWRNILTNAIKFSHPGGTIKVSAEKRDTCWRVTVTDNGIGIDEKSLAALFTLKESIRKQGTAGEKGSGLGLVLCKELVEKNNGSITVESIPGQRTSFHISLPG